MAVNLASKYSNSVSERFSKESQALMACSNEYEFNGVKTVKVFSIPTANMTDYGRTGSARYGTPSELQNTVQEMTLTKDRAFTFTIDRGNKIQSQMVMEAGKALSRQLREVAIPELDTYIFGTLATTATAKGNFNTESITKSNAYEMFLKGQEKLGNNLVPDSGRIAFCSYHFANLLKQDSAFMRYSNMSQEMLIKGIIGEVDGTKIVKVPSSRLPVGCAFILTHPIAAVAPKQLESYKTHTDPPGINGDLVEGRMIYDCFVLDSKANAVYYHGSQGILRNLEVQSVAGVSGKSVITVRPILESGNEWVYKTGTTAATVAYDDVLTTGWTDLPANGVITPTSGHTLVQVAEVNATDHKAKGLGQITLAIGV